MKKRGSRAEEPPLKRPKVTRGEDDYVPGNIIEVELCDFMTYEYFCCKPGSRLNLVMGPNGSGKSSIVCAIALGLGGEPQLLGRATSIGAYVKRGKESGYVKISLRGDTKEEKLVITRRIDARNKSEWLFNGRLVPKREIVEITERFNIQVNNLTQFLPQDRVCEFAKLTPVQLLEETEKAVGDPQLPIQHSTLIEKSRELTNIEIAVKRNGETINQLKAQNAEIEKDVERVRKRDELLLKVELMKKKLPWLVYDMKKAEYVVAKEREKEAKMKFVEATGTLKDLREPIETKKQEKAVLDLDSRKAVNLMNDNAKRRINLIEKENSLGVELGLKYHGMEDLRKQEDDRQQKILKVREDLEAAETELQNLPSFDAPKDLLERLGSQITELEVSAKQKRLQKSEMERSLYQKKGTLKQCTDRLKEMETTSYKCLLALKRNGAEKIVEAYEWLHQHRQALNKEVFGPVLLEINVPDRVHAAYLEGHVAYYIWKSFITQDPMDRDFLVKNLASYDVPVLNYMGHGNSHQKSYHISTEMRELGISSRLDQVFDAPHAVREVLVEQFGLANSYIGSTETDRKADKVAKLGVTDFWTPEHHYRWYKSRYGGPDSAVVEPVDQSRLIQSSCDVGEIESLKRKKEDLEGSVAKLEESIKTLQVEIRTLENEASTLQKEREGIISNTSQEVKKRRELKACVEQRKKKLEAMEKVGDVDAAVERIMDEAKHINIKRLQCAIDLKNSLKEAASLKWSYTAKLMASVEFAAKIGELEVTLSEHQRFADQASVQLEHCKKETEEHRLRLLTAKRHAESIAFITPELEKSFLEMPTTVEDLEAAIQDTISQANSILSLNENVLHEYEYRQKKIADISKKVEADSEELKRCLTEIESLKQSWLPTLRNLVSQINDTFSHNFQEMAVAGEVLLDEHDKDFAQFGILIKVKFRQSGELQVLSAHHQSGGERSVSTILYLVSLQDLTNCPFRVVDEINQGMDPINERKMFQQLVRAASQPNTPQCFLLTPKLLPDLEYGEACSILCIMNGPWIEEPSKVWRSGDSWGAVTGSLGRT